MITSATSSEAVTGYKVIILGGHIQLYGRICSPHMASPPAACRFVRGAAAYAQSHQPAAKNLKNEPVLRTGGPEDGFQSYGGHTPPHRHTGINSRKSAPA